MESEKKGLVKFFWGLLKPFKRYFIGIGIIGLTWSAFTIIRSYALKLIVDGLINGGPNTLFKPMAFYIFSWFMTEGVYRIRDYLLMHLKPYLKKHLVLHFSNKMLGYDELYFQKNTSAGLVSSLKHVYESIEDGIYLFEELFNHFILIASALVSMYLIHRDLSIIALVWFFMWAILAKTWAKQGYILSYLASEARIIFARALGDSFSNISTVKTFNGTEVEEKIFEEKAEVIAQTEFKREKMFLKVWAIQGFSFFLVIGLIFYVLLDGYKKGVVTVGDFAMLLDIIQNVYLYLFDLAKDLSELSEVSGKLSQTIHLLERDQTEANDINPMLDVKEGRIVFDKVRFQYPGQEIEAFNSKKTIEIKPGMMVALVGPSGSGKTTLFRLMLGLLKPVGGRILIDNQNIFQCNIRSVREIFALVPQELGLFHRSIKENIKYGSFNASDAEIKDAAKNAQISQIIDGMANKYDTILEAETNLSGGQKQRLLIARGLLRKAKIFLFDESTAFLDSSTESAILKHIHQTTKDATKIVIAHRLDTIRNADLILVCNKGEFVEQGTHDELMMKKGLYHSLIEAKESLK
jgi:ATP-binding cassette subfamily B protein